MVFLYIQKKAEAILYFVDGMRGTPLNEIELSAKKQQYIQKENGYVIFLHIEKEQAIKIKKRGYAERTYFLKPSQKIQTILLQPIDESSIISISIKEKAWKNKKIYYALNEKICGKKILRPIEKDSMFLPMQYEKNYPLNHRNVAIEGCKKNYTVFEYDFQKKAYLLQQPLEKAILQGQMLFALNETTSDEKGNMTLYFEKTAFQKKENILLFPIE